MNTFLTKVTAYTFFSELILIYPVYALLFTESGISPSQIALLLIIWSATSFLLEVPTGFIADHFSRKNILLVSVVFKLIGYLIWLLFPT
ncbi:MFS transporter, partial [Candidatus Dojkabacteria bacterium]|nr:MFS transporter [Candidatus Dojkabacteria bacterium]